MIAKSKKVKVGVLCSYPEKSGSYLAIPVSNIPDVSPKAEGGDIELVTDKLGSKTSYIDVQHLTISSNFETYLEGVMIPYDSTNEPSKYVSKYHDLFLMCGFEADLTNDDIITYINTSNPSTGNIVVQGDGEFRFLNGASGNLTINAEVGKPLQIQFNIQAYTDTLVPNTGELAELADQNPSYEDMILINKITGFTIDGSTVNMTSLTFDMKTEIQDTYAVQQSEFSLTDYDPQVTVKAYKQKNDQSAWIAFQNQNLQEISLTGSSNNNKSFEIRIPYAKIMDLKESDDSGRVAIERTYRAESGQLGNISITILDV